MNALARMLRSKTAERLKRRLVLATGVHWDVRKLRPNVCTHLQTVRLLHSFRIGVVLDVGANTGQFAEGLFDFGFRGRIVSFEPVEPAHSILTERAASRDNWQVYRRCAIGKERAQVDINVSEASVFSSILDLEPAHVQAKPASRVVAVQRVDVLPLDSLTEELEVPPRSTLLKIDTQGFERQVLDGAARLLQGGLAGVKIEMPLFPIYRHTEWLFEDIYRFLRDLGFALQALNVESVDEASGRTTTLDGIFFREPG
jgi:FkbM family methyltransferase